MATCPGFTKPGTKSRAGRRIVPTSKVREKLAETFCKSYEDYLTNLKTSGDQILADIVGGQDKTEIRTNYEAYISLKSETLDLHDLLPLYVEKETLQKYQDQLNALQEHLEDVDNNAQEYCYDPEEIKRTEDNALDDVMDDEELNKLEEEARLKLEKIQVAQRRLQPDRPPTPETREPSPARSSASDESFRTSRESTKLGTNREFISHLVDALDSRTAIADLPKIEPDIYEGSSLLEFPRWWTTFETAVDHKPISDRRKLLALYNYTSGLAQSSIACFLTATHNPDAYNHAKAILHTRYGNPILVAGAFKKRLFNWPAIAENDGKALLNFSDFLWQVFSAMNNHEYLHSLNSSEENMKLTTKLPPGLRRKWTRKVDKAVFRPELHSGLNLPVSSGQFPSFAEFCQFVAEEARIATGPFSEKLGEERHESSTSPDTAHSYATGAQTTFRPRSNSRGTSDSKPYCSFCKGDHYLYTCNEFLNQTREVKRQYAMKRGLCFGCLRRNHREFECTIQNPRIMQEPLNPAAKPFKPQEATNLHISSESRGSYTMIQPVWIFTGDNPDDKVLTYAAIDTQSDCTFVTEARAEQLHVKSHEVMLNLTTLDSRTVTKSNRVANLEVMGEFESVSYQLQKCYTRESLPVSRDAIPDPSKLKKWNHLADMAESLPAKRENLPIGILIGFDCPEAIMQSETRSAQGAGIHGIRTRLGWTFVGSDESTDREQMFHHCYKTTVREVTHQDIIKAFDLDFQGPKQPEWKMSADDLLFLKIVEEGIEHLDNKHFQTPLPMRMIPDRLPDSRTFALACLQALRKRMKKDPEFSRMYCEFMEKLIKAGHAELVTESDLINWWKCWYWAHHGVTHPAKPGKIRGVFNGNGKVNGFCINDLLLAGPDFINNLVGVLLRFRTKTTRVTSDIFNMFHQVHVTPKFRDFLRFFWFKDGDPDGDILVYRMTVHLFGATSSPGCANFALKETANRFEEKWGKEAADYIRENFYVDDGMGGAEGGPAAKDLILKSHGLCAEGGFHLCKYTCGEKDVLDEIPEELLAPQMQNLTLGANPMETDKALGVELSIEGDYFVQRTKIKDFKPTRRSLLSVLSSVFDPMGLCSPMLLKGRAFLQRLCTQKFSWDKMLSEETMKEWDEWIAEMHEADEIHIERKIRRTATGTLIKIEIHTFSDACTIGYGCCCYSLLEDTEGNVDITLLYAKSRVNPVKTTTMPRLELQAAVLGVKCHNFVKEELRMDVTASYFYTDSSVVLGYILNTLKRFLQYVAHRASFIREYTESTQWRYIATDRNPADIASRGLPAALLRTSTLWWDGPQDEMKRAAELPVGYHQVSEDDPEIKRESVNLKVKAVPEPWILTLSHRYSSWDKYVGVVHRLMQFSNVCRGIEESAVSTRTRAERESGAEVLSSPGL